MSGQDECRLEVADTGIRLSNGLVSVFFDTRTGLIMLTSTDEKTMCFSRAYVQVQTASQVFDSRKMVYRGVNSLDFNDDRGEGKAVVLRLQDAGATGEVYIKLVIIKKLAGYSCVVQFRNRTGSEVRVKSIDTLAIDVDDSSRVYTGWNGHSLRFFRNGFHSWELSQARPISAGDNTSHLYSVLNEVDSGAALVFGFITAADQLSTVTFVGRQTENDRLARVVCRCQTDGVVVPDKQTIVSEEMLVIATDKALDGLERYADVVTQRMKAVPWHNIPTGWCSWYFYYTMPDEEEVLANTRFLQTRLGNEIEWIQLDDGYQKTVGDWQVNPRFEKGLKTLVQNLKRSGYKAGIWVAPFVATEHSELFKTKPSWFVRNDKNEPIAVDQNPLWLGKYYALDLSNPEVLKHVEDVFKTLKADGFEYFKIDFLHHAVADGIRKDMRITRAQALRKGLETIRKAVGEDLILGCGAPFGPCIGVVNAMRIGNDIAPVWRYTWGAGVYECTINTMTRAVLHRRWWTNDPDCLLVRQDDSELTIDELLLWASVVALSGGALLLSDRMMDVPEDRLQIIDRILPPYGRGAIALDSLVMAEPTSFVLPIETELGRWAIVAAVNLTERPIDVSVRLEDAGLDARQPHHMFEFWKQEYQGLTENEVTVKNLKPHSCQLLAVRPESATPSILGTSIHFTQGAVELGNCTWDSAKGELSVIVRRDTKKPEGVFFVCGRNWTPKSAFVDNEEVKLERTAPEVIAVRQVFTAGQSIKVSFRV